MPTWEMLIFADKSSNQPGNYLLPDFSPKTTETNIKFVGFIQQTFHPFLTNYEFTFHFHIEFHGALLPVAEHNKN